MKKESPKGITGDTLAIALIAMTIVTILALVKVYLSNQIYKESRILSSLRTEVTALREENSILKLHVQKLKYKINISDTLFNLDDDAPEELIGATQQ